MVDLAAGGVCCAKSDSMRAPAASLDSWNEEWEFNQNMQVCIWAMY